MRIEPFSEIWSSAIKAIQWRNMSDMASAIAGNSIFLILYIAHDNHKGNLNDLHYWPFLGIINRWPANSHRRRPVIRKAFPCYYVIINITRFTYAFYRYVSNTHEDGGIFPIWVFHPVNVLVGNFIFLITNKYPTIHHESCILGKWVDIQYFPSKLYAALLFVILLWLRWYHSSIPIHLINQGIFARSRMSLFGPGPYQPME